MPPQPGDASCPRPYKLGARAETMYRSRARMLEAARDLLLKGGIAVFNIDAVARRAKVTRQTVHNQFGTRSELLEALFDQVARKGGMDSIAAAFGKPDPASALAEYIQVFARFWASDREMTRRIHGLAAVDFDLSKILAARQERRLFGCRNILNMLSRRYGQPGPEKIETAIRVLYSLTSFEFFDTLAGRNQSAEEVAETIRALMYSFLGWS